MPQFRSLRVRRLLVLLTMLGLIGAAGVHSPAAADHVGAPDITLKVTGGGTIDLESANMATYRTDYDAGGDLTSFELGERVFVDDGLRMVMERRGSFGGLSVFSGLGVFTDPSDQSTHAGLAFAFGFPGGSRTKLAGAIYIPGDPNVQLFTMWLAPSPPTPAAPPVNPFMADSVAPIGHLNAAQSDSLLAPGPLGPTETLDSAALSYGHLGPAHFGVAISPEYPNGDRVIWSNGGDRISKVDYDTLETIAELPIKPTLMDEATADTRINLLDSLTGDDLAFAAFPLAAEELAGLAGVYYVLDVDNTLFVGGATSIIAYGDVDPTDPDSPIELIDEWQKPAEIGGNFVGANMTFDGKLALVTSEGWVVLAERDFSSYQAIELPGNEVAPAHNAAMLEAGFRPGAADWVRNSAAVDADGGIYVPSLDEMHKVVWNGSTLSIDPADGAWTASFLNGRGIGTGATPSLMGFGDEDQFVVITDGEDLMNVVLFWRNDIPAGWQQLPGAPDPRIAGQLAADFDDPTNTDVQSEQSVIVGGYGAAVVNNEPASVPAGFPGVGNLLLVGYAGNDPAFTPHGIQKFEWDPLTQQLNDAWTNDQVSSTNGVPMVSTRSDLMYTVGARNGDWTMEALDWTSGASAFHYVTGSQRYNTRYSGVFLDQEGRLMHTTTYGIVRYER
ncbi:MAG: hypothetical protein ACR2QE_03710 [Acidimicrobiales bacterium]